jgi:hypothetical protein
VHFVLGSIRVMKLHFGRDHGTGGKDLVVREPQGGQMEIKLESYQVAVDSFFSIEREDLHEGLFTRSERYISAFLAHNPLTADLA